MKRTTATEFVEWMEYLNEPTRKELYLAQLCAEVRRSFVKNPSKVKVEDFILKPQSQEGEEDRAQKSKKFWKQLIGLVKNQSKGRKRKNA